MLKVENVEVLGWEHAIRGMRNPKNSWAKSDSGPECPYGKEKCCGECQQNFYIGPNDKQLMMALRNAGTDHRKFMRMITVYLDITAPLYWWKEFDTYKVGTVANSCSTMHKITDKPFELDDFSHEHLGFQSVRVLKDTIKVMNDFREEFIKDHEKENHTVVAEPDGFVSGYSTGEQVVSRHHQGIKSLGRDLKICAKSPDGLPEAIEHISLPVFAVQWHPEQSQTEADKKLFERLVTLCKGGDR